MAVNKIRVQNAKCKMQKLSLTDFTDCGRKGQDTGDWILDTGDWIQTTGYRKKGGKEERLALIRVKR